MWILPTRGRPNNLVRLFRLFVETEMSTGGFVYVDDDDPQLKAYRDIKIPDGWEMVISPRLGLGATINKGFTDHPNEPWYGLITDDSIPVTKRFDLRMIEAAGTKLISYCSNVAHNQAQFGHCLLGGDFVRELGWIILPGLVRIYGENVLYDIGKSRGILRYLPDVVIDHWHFSNGKAPMDKTYEKPEKANDKRIYEEWKRSMSFA